MTKKHNEAEQMTRRDAVTICKPLLLLSSKRNQAFRGVFNDQESPGMQNKITEQPENINAPKEPSYIVWKIIHVGGNEYFSYLPKHSPYYLFICIIYSFTLAFLTWM